MRKYKRLPIKKTEASMKTFRFFIITALMIAVPFFTSCDITDDTTVDGSDQTSEVIITESDNSTMGEDPNWAPPGPEGYDYEEPPADTGNLLTENDPLVDEPQGEPVVIPDVEDPEEIMDPIPQLSKESVKSILNEAVIGSLGGDDAVEELIPEINGSPVPLKEGLSVSVDLGFDPFSLVLTYTFDEYQPRNIDSTVSGIVTASIINGMPGSFITMVINTDIEKPLVLSGGERDGTSVVIQDVTASYQIRTLTLSYNGTIYINGEEKILDDYIDPAKSVRIFKDIITQRLIDRIKQVFPDYEPGKFLKSLFKPVPVYNQDGVTVELGLNVSLTDPGLILWMSYDSFQVGNNKSIAGTIKVLIGFDKLLEGKLKLVLNTIEDSPLVLTTVVNNPIPWLPDITINTPIEFIDVSVYYDIRVRLICEEPEPSGTIVVGGMPLQINGEWIGIINMLLSIFEDMIGNAGAWL